jgi:hypothetical protein
MHLCSEDLLAAQLNTVHRFLWSPETAALILLAARVRGPHDHGNGGGNDTLFPTAGPRPRTVHPGGERLALDY